MPTTADDIAGLVREQIGGDWSRTNAHHVDLRLALVHPKLITIIERLVKNGKVRERTFKAWLVLIEDPVIGEGYRIVAKEDGSLFGLASEGFDNDRHLVLDGWYGDFLTAFDCM